MQMDLCVGAWHCYNLFIVSLSCVPPGLIEFYIFFYQAFVPTALKINSFLFFVKTQLKLSKDIQYTSATPMKLNRITKGWFKKNTQPPTGFLTAVGVVQNLWCHHFYPLSIYTRRNFIIIHRFAKCTG